MAYIKKTEADKFRPDYESTVLEDAIKNDVVVPFSKERIVSGVKAFEDAAGISHATFQKIYNCGINYADVIKLSGKLIFDFPLAMRLLQEYGQKKTPI